MVSPNYQNAANDLNLFANNMHKSASHFRISGRGENQILKKNGKFRQILSRGNSHTLKIKSYIEAKKAQLQEAGHHDANAFVSDKGGYNKLYNSAEKFNKTKHRQIQIIRNLLQNDNLSQKKIDRLEHKKAFLESMDDIEIDSLPDLKPASFRLGVKTENTDEDRPATYKARKFSFGRPFSKKTIQHYPTDTVDGRVGSKPVEHVAEAKRILNATQKERLKAFKGEIKSTIGFNSDSSKKYKYNIYNESKSQYYMQDDIKTPSVGPQSYWFGHATQFFSLPGCTIVTDLVEGALAPGLYPRQTEAGTTAEELPVADIYMLSHNHKDHYDKAAIMKLLPHQPVMIVPEGDGHWYRKMGFHNVSELNWWDSQEVIFDKDGQEHSVTITATPARHWAGQGPCGGHDSTFLGFVIESSQMEDAIYFAGDTARLNDDHIQKLRTKFPNIKTISMPGGPDGGIGPGRREDLATTHQASVDALWVHMELFMKGYIEKTNDPVDLHAFKEEMLKFKTLFMHTMTYKLGNLHLSDTKDSVQKVLDALEDHEDIQNEIEGHLEKLRGEIEEVDNQINEAAGWFRRRALNKRKSALETTVQQIDNRRGPLFDKYIGGALAAKRYEKVADSHNTELNDRISRLERTRDELRGQIRNERDKKTKNELKNQLKETISELKETRRFLAQQIARKGPLYELYLDRHFTMKSYEWQVYNELGEFCDTQEFAGNEKLSRKEMSLLLRDTVIVPKIGSRTDLDKPKADQLDKVYDEFSPGNRTNHLYSAHRVNEIYNNGA